MNALARRLRAFLDDTRVAGRLRIVAWLVGVTAASLVLLVIAMSFILRATVANGIREGIDQEAAEIARFSSEAVDPATGAPFETAERFIEVYIARQSSERGELMVATADGSEQLVELPGPDAPAFGALDPESRAQVLQHGSTGTLQSPTVGTITWRNIEVRVGDTVGFIVVMEFHESREDEIRGQLGLISRLALGVLVATGIVAWWVAGRIERPIARFESAVAKGPRGADMRVPEEGDPAYARIARTANALVDDAEQRVEREQRFVVDAAHELRAPLAVLRGNLEQPAAQPEARETMRRRALAEVLRLEDLVASLVVLTRADRDDYFQPESGVDLGAETRAQVDAWAERARELGRDDVRVEVLAHVDELVTLDRARYGQALDEVLENAVLASPEGGTVRVTTSRCFAADGMRVIIEVADAGRGVPDAERELVFERFAVASNAPQPGGAGLGLAVARRLVEGLGGTLTLERAGDAPGTIARIELPAGGAGAGEAPAAPAAGTAGGPTAGRRDDAG